MKYMHMNILGDKFVQKKTILLTHGCVVMSSIINTWVFIFSLASLLSQYCCPYNMSMQPA